LSTVAVKYNGRLKRLYTDPSECLQEEYFEGPRGEWGSKTLWEGLPIENGYALPVVGIPLILKKKPEISLTKIIGL
jgi:hypothetical protein